MGVTLSLYESGSCSNVELGQSTGRLPAYGLQIQDRGICRTTAHILREILPETSLRTNLYPDFQVLDLEAEVFGNGDPDGDTLIMYPSRDLTCDTQPRILENPFPIHFSEGPDQTICQDVENGFILYCFTRGGGGGPGRATPQRQPCRNQQSLVQGVIETFPLSEKEMQLDKVVEIRNDLQSLATPPPRRGRRGRGRG